MLVKKVLKEIPPTQPGRRHKGKEQFYATARVLKDKKCGKIIVIDIYENKAKGDLVCRFFSDNAKYHLYDVKNDTWSQKGLRSFLYGERRDYYYCSVPMQDYNLKSTDETRQLVHNFFKGATHYECSVTYYTDKFTQDVNHEKYQRQQENKEFRLKKHMQMFPEIPKDFDEFLNGIFENYVFTDKVTNGMKPGVCTACGKTVMFPKAIKHRTYTECPNCKRMVTVFEKRHIDSIKEKRCVFVAHKVENQLLLRWVDVVGGWLVSDDGMYSHWYSHYDYFRTMYLYENGKPKVLHYDYKYVYPYGTYWREQKNWNRDDLAYVYDKNLTEVFGKKYYNIDLHEELCNCTQPLRFVHFLDNLKTLPPAEYLAKLGMLRLASEIDPSDLGEGRDFGTILGVNPQYKKMYSEWNISLDEHHIIQASNAWVSEDDFIKMRKLNFNSTQVNTVCRLLETMSYRRFVNYFTKQRQLYRRNTWDQILRWYDDYIRMSEQMGVDLSHKSVRFPKDIKAAHDDLITKFKAQEMEICDEQMRKATENLYNGLTEYKSDGYAIVFPKTRTEFIKEGQSLNHCVGTQEMYFKNHLEGTRMIFFIRHEEEIEKPFVTMEIDMRELRIRQIYGYGDKTPAKEVRDFADRFLKLLKKDTVRRTA